MCTGHDDTASREEVARLSRRGFLRTAVTTAAVVGASSALAAPALAQEGAAGSQGHSRHRVPRDQISIQLFTLRDQLAIDFEGTIATLAEIGYTRVEHAGFVGRTVAEFKAVLDANGIVSTSGHVLIPQPFDPAAWSRLAGRRHTPWGRATSSTRSSGSTSAPARWPGPRPPGGRSRGT